MWKMPEELEPYRKYITNTGGNEVEDLMNRLENDKNLSQSNIIVFSMAMCVSDQVSLLERLHKSGLLKTEETHARSKHSKTNDSVCHDGQSGCKKHSRETPHFRKRRGSVSNQSNGNRARNTKGAKRN